jgi:hypothetical protein
MNALISSINDSEYDSHSYMARIERLETLVLILFILLLEHS